MTQTQDDFEALLDKLMVYEPVDYVYDPSAGKQIVKGRTIHVYRTGSVVYDRQTVCICRDKAYAADSFARPARVHPHAVKTGIAVVPTGTVAEGMLIEVCDIKSGRRP